ncbi:multidrug effflux MFS transporter [Hydrogenophaga sp. 5NK40-0174]|uniref:multidrug effflux MFS transporter n=1 Tax=Hydrogenophaga sp. 5NK40-0174 TaxID=3127649 RepID=UPI00310AFC9A
MSEKSPAMSQGMVVLVLSLLLGLQPVTTDLYLPALPSMTEGFGASLSQAQLTLTALLLAFGASQLVWGPVSDRFGRRPVLLVGAVLYVVASTANAFASSMEELVLWRTVQGVAMGAGVMCARAVVRDLYSPLEGARAMSKGLSGLGVIACMSAPLGGVLTEYFGWRVALSAVTVFGVLTLVVLALRFEETLQPENRRPLNPARMLGTWGEILRNPTFWTFTLLASFSYAGLFTFLAAGSFVLIKVIGLSRAEYGLTMLSMSLSYIVGTFICRRMLPKLGVRRTVAIAGAVTITGGSAIGILALMGIQNVYAIMVPFYIFMLGHGVHQPCGQSGAVSPFPQAAGAASALSGFLMMILAFFIGGWLGTRLGDNTVYPLTNGIWFWSVAITLTAWTMVQRFGEAKTPPQRVLHPTEPDAPR